MNSKVNGFYKCNVKSLSKEIVKDPIKCQFNMFLMMTENMERVSGTMPLGHFKLTKRQVMDFLNVSDIKARRLIKEFENLGIIECIEKSNKKGIPSVYCYTSVAKVNDKPKGKVIPIEGYYDWMNE